MPTFSIRSRKIHELDRSVPYCERQVSREPRGAVLGLRQVEDQYFRVVYARELQRLLRGDCCTIAGVERLAVQRDAAARDLHVRVATGLQRVLDGFTGRENRGVEFVVLANLHRTIAAVGRNDEAQ